MPHQTLSLNDVAEYLHISVQDVLRLVRGHEIPHERAGDRVVFRKQEVAAWASQRILGFKDKELQTYHRSSSVASRIHADHDLILPSLIKPAYIAVDVPARTRSAAIRAMVKLADSTELLYQPEDLLDSILAREELCTTALPGGFALLHPRHHDPYMLEESFVAFASTINPVPFGSPDGATTDLFALICCNEDRLHLHTLARLSTILSHAVVRADLRNATSQQEVYEILMKAEQNLAN